MQLHLSSVQGWDRLRRQPTRILQVMTHILCFCTSYILRSHAVCGPPKYAEIRINLAQAFNGIGTVVAPALASYVFFTDTADNVNALKRVQWVYLAIGIFVFVLAGVFFMSTIPEVTDEDMAYQVSTTHVSEQEKPFWKQYKLFHATLAQFTYTGSQGNCPLLLGPPNC